MNTRKIMALRRKADIEAEKAVKKVYKQYRKEMIDLIANEIDKGTTLLSINGMNRVVNSDNELVHEDAHGCAWGRHYQVNEQLTKIADLQYGNEIVHGFLLPMEIKGKKKRLK